MQPLLRRIPHPFPLFSARQLHSIVPTASSAGSRASAPLVAVFWDLDNRPHRSIRPYDAAVRLRTAASSLGLLRLVFAYATSNMLSSVPAPAHASRRASPPSAEPSICRVCGRKFYAHSKLLNHFKIHEREHAKRLNRINSATGSRYVRLKARLDLKMKQYSKVEREILVPGVVHSVGDELRRAGVSVRVVEDRLEAAHGALSEHMMETIDCGKIGCLVLVSHNARFSKLIREARMRCLKTVVVGDDGDGELKRHADAFFSWKDVVSGKARKEASSAILKWNDKDLLKKLEWRHQPELAIKEGECKGGEWEDSDSGDESASEGCEDLSVNRDSKPWWKLD